MFFCVMNSLISEFPGLIGKNPPPSTFAQDGERKSNHQGWVFYDGECGLCLDLVRRFEARLTRAGFALAPLQTQGVQERLGLTKDNLLSEMKVMDSQGNIFGGAEAVVTLSKYIWWARPLAIGARIPGVRIIL